MDLTARDLMKTDLRTVNPEMTLTELEREFIAEGVGGFPVVDEGRLVGIVSRSDVVRQLCVEQSLAEEISYYYYETTGYEPDANESLEEVAGRVGKRIEHLHVKDVMISDLISVRADQDLKDVGRTLLDRRIHRVPVTDGGRLVGIISALDFVRLYAKGASVGASTPSNVREGEC